MQGLPFDDSDFPPPAVTSTTTWIDHSPRLISPAGTANAAGIDEDIYRIVAGQPAPSPQPPQVATSDVIQRYSQQMPVMSTPAASPYVSPSLQAPFQHQPPQPHQTQHQRSPLAQQSQQIHQVSMAQRIGHSQNHNTYIPASNATLHHQPTQVPARRQRASASQSGRDQMDSKRMAKMSPSLVGSSMVHQGPQSTKHQLQQSNPDIANPGSSVAGPSAVLFDGKDARKPVRSAVEEARLRAQREAESFANSRRGPVKREATVAGSTIGSHSDASGKDIHGDRRSSKRLRHELDKNIDGQGSRKTTSKGSGSDEKGKQEDDSEVEKQERYKRRLDMNRESAAVSRVRRRAYVKELEERLAAVEAEKFQLEGKLEIMMTQNEGFKKQLDDLFLMVTSGRQPQYPPSQGEGS